MCSWPGVGWEYKTHADIHRVGLCQNFIEEIDVEETGQSCKTGAWDWSNKSHLKTKRSEILNQVIWNGNKIVKFQRCFDKYPSASQIYKLLRLSCLNKYQDAANCWQLLTRPIFETFKSRQNAAQSLTGFRSSLDTFKQMLTIFWHFYVWQYRNAAQILRVFQHSFVSITTKI